MRWRGEDASRDLRSCLSRGFQDPIVKQPSFFCLASGYPPELSVRILRCALPKEEAERRNGACVLTACSKREHATGLAKPVSPYGAPAPLSENRHPWRQCASRGELRDSNPGLRSEPGGYRPRAPGTTAANRRRRHRFPLTFSFASRTFLRRAGTGRE